MPRVIHFSADLRTPKLSHLVAEELRGRIAAGALRPGDSLPPELELLQRYSVSRPVMREALRVLESEGLILLGRGARAGATVLAPSIEAASRYGGQYLGTQGTTLGEIHQVRALLEPPLAALLAEKPNAGLLAELSSCVEKQQEALEAGDYGEALKAVSAFHDLMVGHTENRALSLLAGMVHDIATKVYPLLLTSEADNQAVRMRTERARRAHGRLLVLLRARKRVAAEAFWRRYMEETGEFLAKTGLARLVIGSSASGI